MIDPFVFAGLNRYEQVHVLLKVGLSPEVIIKKVADYLIIKKGDVIGDSRERKFAEARQIAMYFLKKYTSLTLKEIGEYFGGRDHSTVVYSIKNISGLIETTPYINARVKSIDKLLWAQ